MIEPHIKFASSKPRVGDEVIYRDKPQGTISSVSGNLCWVKYYDGTDPLPFIWCFKEGVNSLHDWPTKNKADEIPKRM